MKVIFKYQAPMQVRFSFSMPAGAEILTTQVQRKDICIWAKVERGGANEVRNFLLIGTGHEFDESELGRLEYVGTLQVEGGEFVFHLFEIKAT